MVDNLRLHQEILLLALRDDQGTFSGGMYQYSIAGAMVSELLLQERIVANDDKTQTVAVVNEKPTGDPLLDELLGQIVKSTKHKGLQHWVSKAAGIPKLPHRIAEQLCDLGVLRHDEKKILWLFTQQIYPELDGTCEDAIRARMANVMFHEEAKPDAHTLVLIALASCGGLLRANFAPDELHQHKQRIDMLAKGDILATGATQAAIQAVQTAIMIAAIIPVITTTAATSH
jgi:Golgi phosphoprotein 3